MTELREKVARAINPIAFKSWQSMYDFCLPSDGPEKAKLYADSSYKDGCDKALNAADAAIATVMEAVREPFDEWVEAVAECWGQGSETHNVARDGRAMLSAFKGTDNGQ